MDVKITKSEDSSGAGERDGNYSSVTYEHRCILVGHSNILGVRTRQIPLFYSTVFALRIDYEYWSKVSFVGE